MSMFSLAGSAPRRSVMKRTEIQVLPVPLAEVGEGAIWCDRAQALWWVDIGRSTLHRYLPDIQSYDAWQMPAKIGCLALTDDTTVIVARADGLFIFDPANAVMSYLCGFPGNPIGNRPNDGAVSRSGRFFLGTIPLGDRSMPHSHLFTFDGKTTTHLFGGLHVANGLAFSPDDRTAYLSDSFPDVQTIWAFDHDPSDGILSNRRVFFDACETAGRPDGACIDTDGCYWMAGVGGAEVLRLTPTGRIDLRIDLPAERPSKPCFGGGDLRRMFVTTIGTADATGGYEGAVLAFDLPYQGLKEGRLTLE